MYVCIGFFNVVVIIGVTGVTGVIDVRVMGVIHEVPVCFSTRYSQ